MRVQVVVKYRWAFFDVHHRLHSASRRHLYTTRHGDRNLNLGSATFYRRCNLSPGHSPILPFVIRETRTSRQRRRQRRSTAGWTVRRKNFNSSREKYETLFPCEFSLSRLTRGGSSRRALSTPQTRSPPLNALLVGARRSTFSRRVCIAPKISMRLIINYRYWLVRPVLFSQGAGVAHTESGGQVCSSRGRRGDVRKAGRRCSASQHSFARPLTLAVLSEGSSRLLSIPSILVRPSSSSTHGRKKGKKDCGRAGGREVYACVRACACACACACDRLGAHMLDL